MGTVGLMKLVARSVGETIKLIIKSQQTMYSFIKTCQEVIKNKSLPQTTGTITKQPQIKSCDLEHVARSNLCELSENICKEEATMRRQPIERESQYYDCSPWGLKKQKICLEKDRGRIRKDACMKVGKQVRSFKNSNSVASSQDKQNLIHAKLSKYAKDEYQVQKYPSIFMRIKAAKDIKGQMTYKDRSQTEIITIMRKKKSNPNDYADLKKMILAEQVENYANNLKVFNKKIEDLEVLKKNSLNSIKQMPYCLIETEENDKEGSSAKQPKISIDHWKTRRTSIKSKKSKKGRETKSIERKDSKQNMSSASKKTSISLEKGRDQYQSSNPLTRLLYEKYINTISISHYRQQKFQFL